MARDQNRATEAYIKGHREIPKETPAMYKPGSREEAICFADLLQMAWHPHKRAMEWLLKEPKPRR